MKCKNGYKHDKPRFKTGKWLKRYFEKRTTRKFKIKRNECKQRLEKANLLLREVVEMLRPQYPKEFEEDIVEVFGDLGQPWKLLNEIEEYLSDKWNKKTHNVPNHRRVYASGAFGC